jgi:Organic Anion Transporter Polypeptide (OATP) family.
MGVSFKYEMRHELNLIGNAVFEQLYFILCCTFRCVAPEDKSFAQGLSLVLVSLLAFIPGPIIYGAIIGK